ncbi:hypothetical protein [Bacteriophage sp.]|nr:hypothetical protein [Bacteriophage sp.]UOF80141.1 hypothetical protein [Bacteriophage sp.]
MIKKKVTIERPKWNFGAEIGSEARRVMGPLCYLLNGTGYRCCLGFAIQQLYRHYTGGELPAEAILWKNMPGKVEASRYTPELVEGTTDSAFSIIAARINDSVGEEHTEREHKLQKLFQEHGIELEFAGQYLPGQLDTEQPPDFCHWPED